MSTRSIICKKTGNKLKYIYCHFDGYLEAVGLTLYEFYKDEEKVDRLLARGDLSYLHEEPGENGQDWNHPEDNCSLAYRDRGEDNIDAKEIHYDEIEEAAANCSAEYVYVYENGEWYLYEDKELTPLKNFEADMRSL